MTKQMHRYLVINNGLSQNTSYSAADPDEALMHAHRYERFLRICAKYPGMSEVQAVELSKDETMEIPDFHIEHCIIVEAETGDS